jgi:hypothetical protein
MIEHSQLNIVLWKPIEEVEKMNRIAAKSFWTIVFGLIFLISVGSLSAQQKKAPIGPVGPLWEDTAINPHDFTNAYYASKGIVGRAIMNRRTGSDGLSVFGNSSNPFHRNVRVIATLPAYDQYGGMHFWYPLGDIGYDGFTLDELGWQARQAADMSPIYVFPDSRLQDTRIFATARQAALIDNTWAAMGDKDMNSLGVRQVLVVTYTAKAYTKEGVEMMTYMSQKNGMTSDDMPILCSMDDLHMMMKYELIAMAPSKMFPTYAIAPMIANPTNGVIAPDAFLWFATKDGSPLPSEAMFSTQFGCLQKTGYWCKEPAD